MSLAGTNQIPGVRFANTKDGCVVLDLEHDRFLKLNSVAGEMLQHLAAGTSPSEIVDIVAERYRVGKPQVSADLSALIARFHSLGVALGRTYIVEAEPPRVPSAESSSLKLTREIKDQAKPSVWMVLCALCGLAIFDITLWVVSFKSLCRLVKAWPLKRRSSSWDVVEIARLCNAVEQGCIWYPRKALCLQRSGVATCLLRNRGVPAHMIVGTRPMPFLAHAWVEVDDCVVNDSPGVRTFYQTLSSF